ncbi:RNA-binding protein [Pseudohyphozyma bogoriensis]|nr:RNA-binding protein [Pseudohyphozyma bogoriensis]
MSGQSELEVSQSTTAAPAAPEPGFKVFVGNLAFSTKDADLTDAFSKVGEIYGFVTYATESSAVDAVSKLDKSELSGRQINVELAKPPSSTPKAPREKKEKAPKKEAAAPKEEVEVAEAAVPAEGEAAAAPKAKKAKAKKPVSPIIRTSSSRNKGARKPRTDGETEEAGDAPIAASGDVKELSSALAATTLETPAEGADATTKPRRGRKPASERKPRTPPTGEPSKTLLFVANLPFSVKDDELKTIFEGYKVVSARVVTKKFGPTEGRSKGFGFVDFESTEEQQKALSALQDKEIEGRKINLKVAVEQEKKEEEKKEEETGETGLGEGEIIAS